MDTHVLDAVHVLLLTSDWDADGAKAFADPARRVMAAVEMTFILFI